MRGLSTFRRSLRALSTPIIASLFTFVIASQRRGNHSEKGLTLVEMLVVVALVGIIVGGAAVSIATIFKSTDITNVHNIALRQVQNVGFWVSRDVLAAKPGTIDCDGSDELLSLTRYDWNGTSFDELAVTYTFDGNKLKRQVSGSSSSESLIAEYIESASFEPGDEGKYILTVKAVVSKAFARDRAVERTYEISPRLTP